MAAWFDWIRSERQRFEQQRSEEQRYLDALRQQAVNV
jgi:hypothetical protein